MTILEQENQLTKICFLVSGGGGNLKVIYSLENDLGVQIACVLADRNCDALDFARDKGIPNQKFKFNRSPEDDGDIIAFLGQLSPAIVVTNIHKVLSPQIISLKGLSFVNLHYSLLPAFQGEIGMAPVYKAITRNNAFSGVTCHEVIEAVDEGPTLSQAVFPLDQDDQDSIRVTFRAGALCLVASVHNLISGGLDSSDLVQVFDEEIHFRPPLPRGLARSIEIVLDELMC